MSASEAAPCAVFSDVDGTLVHYRKHTDAWGRLSAADERSGLRTFTYEARGDPARDGRWRRRWPRAHLAGSCSRSVPGRSRAPAR